MTTWVRAGLSAILSALIIQATNIVAYMTFWKDATDHRALPLIITFLVLWALIYVTIGDYISTVVRSRFIMPLATLLVIVIIAIRILDVQSLFVLPNSFLQYTNTWYALPVALGLYFLALYFC